jgi:hypothetical protein
LNCSSIWDDQAQLMASEPKRCLATKAGGDPCNAIGVLESGYCFHHDPDRREEAHQARVRGGEATRKPKATETLREMVEADIEAWLKPYVDGQRFMVALVATKACVTLKTGPNAIPAGESARELRTRVAALLDADESLIAPAVVDVEVNGDESLAIIVRILQEQDSQGADPPTNLAAARDAVIQVQRALGGLGRVSHWPR